MHAAFGVSFSQVVRRSFDSIQIQEKKVKTTVLS